MLNSIHIIDICQLLISKQFKYDLPNINTPFVGAAYNFSILRLIN